MADLQELNSLDKLFSDNSSGSTSGIYIDPSIYNSGGTLDSDTQKKVETANNNDGITTDADGYKHDIRWTEDGTYGMGSLEDWLDDWFKRYGSKTFTGKELGYLSGLDKHIATEAYYRAIELAKAQYEAQEQAKQAQSSTGDTSITASAEEIRNAEQQLAGINNPYPEDYTGNQQAVDTQQAIAEGAQTAQQEAEKSAAASASAGINKSRAGMLSDSGTQSAQTNNVSNISMANATQNASTQADYLNKMNQADALDQQAKFQTQGAGIQALGAGIQGAASGLAMGGVIGSDENIKTSPDDFDAKLSDAINQFKILYKRVKEKRSRK